VSVVELLANSTVCSGPRADRTSPRPTGCEVTVISDPTAAVVHPHAADADRRRQRIKLLLETMIQNRGKVLDLITEASESHDHIALGFKSWTDYVRTEYAGLLTRLTVEDRRETVLILSRTGLSTRAIAPIVGTNHSTIVRDLLPPARSQVFQMEHLVWQVSHMTHLPPSKRSSPTSKRSSSTTGCVQTWRTG